ncbi:MAG: hypothetical protein R3F59_06800 [Myxococcota bacterium]
MQEVEPAPAELDALLHWTWARYDEGDDEALAGAVTNLDAAVGGQGLVESFDGSVSRLDREEAALVGVTDRDPGDAAGIFLVDAFACDFDQLQEILSYPGQDELFLDVYDAYARTFEQSRDAWLAGDVDRIDYDIDYTASLLGATYVAAGRGALRRLPDLGDPEVTPFGPAVLQRSYLPAPAAFEGDSNKSLDQDYQLEVYWPRGEGRVVHVYGMWRQANFGSGLDMENESAQRILLNNLLDWDDNTAALCAEGRP